MQPAGVTHYIYAALTLEADLRFGEAARAFRTATRLQVWKLRLVEGRVVIVMDLTASN